MAKRKIVWTGKANLERKEILEYWINRNKSKTFSVKLNQLFIQNLRHLAENPTTGRKTESKNIRVKNIRDYLLFYEIRNSEIIVLTLWDGRRNEKTLNLK